jgi:hypothetical protein
MTKQSTRRTTPVFSKPLRYFQTIATLVANKTKLSRQGQARAAFPIYKAVYLLNPWSAIIDALPHSAIDAKSRERPEPALVAIFGDLFHEEFVAWFDDTTTKAGISFPMLTKTLGGTEEHPFLIFRLERQGIARRRAEEVTGRFEEESGWVVEKLEYLPSKLER